MLVHESARLGHGAKHSEAALEEARAGSRASDDGRMTDGGLRRGSSDARLTSRSGSSSERFLCTSFHVCMFSFFFFPFFFPTYRKRGFVGRKQECPATSSMQRLGGGFDALAGCLHLCIFTQPTMSSCNGLLPIFLWRSWRWVVDGGSLFVGCEAAKNSS